MKQSIEQLMQEFNGNPFWGIDKLKKPDPSTLKSFLDAYSLPEDYIELLTITDGFVLFQAGDFRISDIDWVLQCKTNMKYNPGFKEEILVIGYFLGYNLLINQNESKTAQYLYAGDAYTPDDYVRVGTITDFLNGFWKAKGEVPFWEIETEEKFNFLQD